MDQTITVYQDNVEDMADWSRSGCHKHNGTSSSTVKYNSNYGENDGPRSDCARGAHRRNYINPNNRMSVNDLDKSKIGVPCPGAKTAIFTGNDFNTMECNYNNVTADSLRSLATSNDTNGTSGSMVPGVVWTQLAHAYCKADPSRASEVVNTVDGNKTCQEVVTDVDLSQEYCSTGDNILSDPIKCSRSTLPGALYDTIATTWCTANKSNAWCSCYNNLNGVCTTDTTAGGCADTQAVLEALPEKSRALFGDTQRYCVTPACRNGTGFIPTSAKDITCNMNVAICSAPASAQGFVQSQLNIKQNCDVSDSTNDNSDTTNDNSDTTNNNGGSSTPSPSSSPSSSPEDFLGEHTESIVLGGGGIISLSFSMVMLVLLIK